MAHDHRSRPQSMDDYVTPVGPLSSFLAIHIRGYPSPRRQRDRDIKGQIKDGAMRIPRQRLSTVYAERKRVASTSSRERPLASGRRNTATRKYSTQHAASAKKTPL